jgi:probable phosphoglycerate mutase
MAREIWLIRHGETEWSRSGAHTGRTDLPLTSEGERRAVHLRSVLAGQAFDLVLTSPLQRARRTCELAGFGRQAILEPNLVEWDYGAYEGKSTEQIRQVRPEWSLFRDGVPGGETLEQVAARTQMVIDRIGTSGGNSVALFAHGHVLRILTACWLELAPAAGARFALSTAGVSVLGYEHEVSVIDRWNFT